MTRIDHIGILVSDLEQAAQKLRVLFGKPSFKELPEVGLRVAEFQTENVRIELLQYTTRSEFARRVMGRRLGLNHVSAEVEDVDRSIRELAEAGFKPMEGFPREGAHGRVAFFEPDAVTGLLFEVCEPHD
jgi:methylmalonyl-CoA epimerase